MGRGSKRLGVSTRAKHGQKEKKRNSVSKRENKNLNAASDAVTKKTQKRQKKGKAWYIRKIQDGSNPSRGGFKKRKRSEQENP